MEDNEDERRVIQGAQQEVAPTQSTDLEWPPLASDRANPEEAIVINPHTAQPSTPKTKMPEGPSLPSDKLYKPQTPNNPDHYAIGVNPFDPNTSPKSRGSQ